MKSLKHKLKRLATKLCLKEVSRSHPKFKKCVRSIEHTLKALR